MRVRPHMSLPETKPAPTIEPACECPGSPSDGYAFRSGFHVRWVSRRLVRIANPVAVWIFLMREDLSG